MSDDFVVKAKVKEVRPTSTGRWSYTLVHRNSDDPFFYVNFETKMRALNHGDHLEVTISGGSTPEPSDEGGATVRYL